MKDVTRELPRSGTPPKRSEGSITHFIVHHTAVSGSLLGHARFHTNPATKNAKGQPTGRGWPILAYHYYVGKDGEPVRTNDLSDVGYHARGWNYRAVGIVIEGNFEKAPPTPAQLLGAKAAVLDLEQRLGHRLIPQWHDVTKLPKVYSCPGKHFPKATFLQMLDEHYAIMEGYHEADKHDPEDIACVITLPTVVVTDKRPEL